MTTTLHQNPKLSLILPIAGLVLAGSALAGPGLDITYPGAPLNSKDQLVPENSFSGNRVTITGGIIPGNAYAALATSEDATGNTLTMTGGTARWLLGGYSKSGNATGNSVYVSGGALTGGVNGAETGSGDASFNRVSFNTVTATWANGGYSASGNASGNEFIMNGGVVNNNAFGGYVNSGDGEASHNVFIMNDGEIGIQNDSVASGFPAAYGITGGSSRGGDASYNQVVMNGGHTGIIEGGNGTTAIGNRVTINGGRVDHGVTGGKSDNGRSTGNTIEIRGGSFGDSYIYGGRADHGDATHNTVILGGDADLSLTHIFGGWNAYMGLGAPGTDIITGNTLVIDDYRGSIQEINKFEHYDIRVSTWNGNGDSLVTLTRPIKTDLSNTTIRVSAPGFSSSAPLLQVGDSISLIGNETGIITDGMTIETPVITGVKRGIALCYDMAVASTSNSISASITAVRLNPQTKSLLEGRAAALALVNQGADLIAAQGISQAVQAAQYTQTKPSGMAAFLAMSGGRSQYDTGSHIDVSGFSMLTGLATTPAAIKSMTLAGFFETGHGDYTTHNSFDNAAFVRGSGNSDYYGGGLLGRYDLSDHGVKGLALDASFRAGRLDTDYNSGDLTDSAGNGARYSLSSPYYGGHVGLTHATGLGSKTSVATYAQFLWMHQEGDHASISGDRFHFRSMNSQRLRGGARFHYAATSSLLPYAGLAYEWECGGASRAATYGQDIAAPSLRGGTGMGELGVMFQPVSTRPLFIDLGVRGYVGTRQGISGNLQFRMEF